jgi:hypothetical protein
MNEEEIQVIEAMEKYGGSFVKALANAYRHADPYNRGMIRQCWKDYWKTYQEKGV